MIMVMSCESNVINMQHVSLGDLKRHVMLSSTILWDRPSYQWLVGPTVDARTGLWLNYDGTVVGEVRLIYSLARRTKVNLLF